MVWFNGTSNLQKGARVGRYSPHYEYVICAPDCSDHACLLHLFITPATSQTIRPSVLTNTNTRTNFSYCPPSSVLHEYYRTHELFLPPSVLPFIRLRRNERTCPFTPLLHNLSSKLKCKFIQLLNIYSRSTPCRYHTAVP